MNGDKLALRCTDCGRVYTGPRLHCDICDGLLRTDYTNKAFEPNDRNDLFAFLDWLPPKEPMVTPIGPTVYRSERLAERLGMNRLAIAFNGYAPEIGAENPTGSFKDFEALPTLLYLRENGIDSVVLASAGNTARAFAHAATVLEFRVVLVAPEEALHRLWSPIRISDAVRLVAIEETDDYALAIDLAGEISKLLEVPFEGGTRNVARRDGLGTVLLEYARTFGELPAHYVQAVGSGTGGIAVWEAAQRLIDAGVGDRLPVLHLAQNAPFTPIHDAWAEGKPIEPERDVEGQRTRIDRIAAQVLANRNPPYAIAGGVRDALTASEGRTYAVSNAEAAAAHDLFTQSEGFQIGPASAVAVAALMQALANGRILRSESTLLHITGNNGILVRRDFPLHPIEPIARLRANRRRVDDIVSLRMLLAG